MGPGVKGRFRVRVWGFAFLQMLGSGNLTRYRDFWTGCSCLRPRIKTLF